MEDIKFRVIVMVILWTIFSTWGFDSPSTEVGQAGVLAQPPPDKRLPVAFRIILGPY